MNIKEKILILNGSISELPIIEEAKKMGYYVMTTGNMPELIGHKYADKYIPADYSDEECILHLVKENEISHIVSCANDFGVLTASYVAEKMGWKGHDSYKNAVLLHHKDKFKEYCVKKNIPSPKSKIFLDMDSAYEYINNCGYPIIVKANDLTGGKGILKAENVSEAKIAVKNAFEKSRDKHILIEPFLKGQQQSFGAFISKGKIISSFSTDCYSPINPYLIQTETLPARGIEKIREELEKIICTIVDDLQLVDGILCLQYIVCDGKPYVIKMMRRCFGNQFLTLARMNSGFPWEKAYILAAMGKDTSSIVSKKPKYKYCGHHGIMANCNGILRGYSIDDSIKSHIFQSIEILKPGTKIHDYLNERIAYIWYSYDSPDEMIEAAKSFNKLIKIDLE